VPNYLLELSKSAPFSNMKGNTRRMVIFAADEAGARRAAQGRFTGDGNDLWRLAATVTELVVGTTLADSGADGWTLFCRITGGAAQVIDPMVVTVDGLSRDSARGILGKPRLGVRTAIKSSLGTGYAVDDILTITGGTFTRPTTFRIVTLAGGSGVGNIELEDPGEYEILPTEVDQPLGTAFNSPTTDGGGTGTTIKDLLSFAPGSFEAILSRAVTELTMFPSITPKIEMSEGAAGPRLLTLAQAGDNIGDATITVEFRHNGQPPETVFLGTITHEGAAGAALSVALQAIPFTPARVIVI